MGLVVKILLALIVFLALYTIFFKPTFYENIFDKIDNLFSIPERDPLPWQSGNASERKLAVSEYKDFIDAYKKTATSTNGDFCFGGFKAFPAQFYEKKYYIELANEGGKTSIRLFQLFSNDKNEGQGKVLEGKPIVSPEIIEGVEPCLVYGNEVASNFYSDLLHDEPENRKVKIGNYVFPVGKIVLKEDSALDYHKDVAGTKTDSLKFERGEERTVYYLMKQQNHICLMPTSDPGFLQDEPGCEYTSKDGLTDTDCLDYDTWTGNDKRLPYLLLPGGRLENYVCNKFTAQELI